MSRRRLKNPSIVAICALTVCFLAGPQVVQADGVDDAKRKLERILDDLEQLRNEIDQNREDYYGALDRQDELVVEIEASQRRVDEMSAELGDVQVVVQQVAVNRFTSGDSFALSPLFSDASSYSLAGQRAALSTFAINSGEGSIDDLQSIVDDLAAERAALAVKHEEATQLVATLETKRTEMSALEEDYLARVSRAETQVGKAKLRAAEKARAEAAQAQEEMARAVRQERLNSLPRGAGSAPRYRGEVPAVSGKAGIAVAAAYSQIGVPYVAYAASPGTGFDCSGLTQWVWGQAGAKLPHQSGQQARMMPEVNREDMQPGDLVFYQRPPMHHVGIYVGGGQMIHAPAPGKHVGLTNINWSNVTSIGRPG